ncbi:uncharacterized protein [Typha angustifolia]|uniref:uncharacterized protein isoform X1 n=1 Tax=Typha angustifolia TaxID=59011 RepID=UPI003C30C7E5
MTAEAEEVVYKTKVVQFLGRSTPIVLQNDNGPCPLLAICNVLLLKNAINLSSDATEVSLQMLLSLVAERLIDSNSNVQGKDDEYVNNQWQNIADAMDLLPRLGNGIDVNVQFRKINDFEFTRECAIFDLLDIPLCHGWIVDPQDTETAEVIGPRSYNMLIGDLIAFETQKSEGKSKQVEEEDYVDFSAATTAALGVPSPNVAGGRTFDSCVVSVASEQRRRGDIEEEEELMRVLNLSKAESSDRVNVSVPPATASGHSSSISEGSTQVHSSLLGTPADTFVPFNGESERLYKSNLFSAPEENVLSGSYVIDDSSLTKLDAVHNNSETVSEGLGEILVPSDSGGSIGTQLLMNHLAVPVQSIGEDGSDGRCSYNDPSIVSEVDQSVTRACRGDNLTSQNMLNNNVIGCDSTLFPSQVAPCTDSCTDIEYVNTSDMLSDVSEVVPSTLAGAEPIYQGGENILTYRIPSYQNQESVYEGKMVLPDKTEKHFSHCSEDEVFHHPGQVIKNFFEKNATQLTIYGLFCLQEGLKERELCVFFRNNHFSTMFKYNGELFLLATDQGYIYQPNLVWEKLNEVNGDTLLMTSDFTEFKAEEQGSESWNEQHPMTDTTDYVPTLGSSPPSDSSINSDFQLAIELQQQEFEQQQEQPQQHSQQRPQKPQHHQHQSQHHQKQSQRRQQQQQHPLQQPSGIGPSRLVIGPQVHRNPRASQRNDSKPNDKCTLM